MANEGEEEYEIPSAIRKKEIELSKGVVLLPPERMKRIEREAREEEKESAQMREERPQMKAPAREERKVTSSRPGAGFGPSAANVLAVFAIIIALVAVGFSYLTLNSYNQMRTELRGVIEDLKAFRASDISIPAELTSEHVINEEIPLKDILSPVSFPVSKVLEVSGNVLFLNPSTRTYESAPYNGNLTVTGVIDIDPTQLDPNKKMRINYTIPGKGALTIKVPVEQIWSSDLDNLISRFEKIAQ